MFYDLVVDESIALRGQDLSTGTPQTPSPLSFAGGVSQFVLLYPFDLLHIRLWSSLIPTLL